MPWFLRVPWGGLTGSYRCEVIVVPSSTAAPEQQAGAKIVVFDGSLRENQLRSDTFSISKTNVGEQSRRFSSSLRLLRLLIFCFFSFFCGRKRAKQATVTWKVTGQLYSDVLAFAAKMVGSKWTTTTAMKKALIHAR